MNDRKVGAYGKIFQRLRLTWQLFSTSGAFLLYGVLSLGSGALRIMG